MTDSHSADPGASRSRDGDDVRIRVLVIQSDVAPADAVLQAFPADRFVVNVAGDALAALAAATARDVDVLVLDAPLFDLEVDTLLWRLDADGLAVPVVVLGATAPPQPMRLRFPVCHLPKPVAIPRLTQVAREFGLRSRARRSMPPAGAAPAEDFLEWSQLTDELAGESGSPPPAAAPSPVAPVPAPSPVDLSLAARPTLRPAPAGPEAPAVAVDQLLAAYAGSSPAPPGLAGRNAVLVGRGPEILARLALILREAGMEVRVVEGDPAAAWGGIADAPPDLVVLDAVDEEEAAAAALRAYRAVVRLWHRPLLGVTARGADPAAAKANVRGVDDTVHPDIPAAELLARVALLLAPVEQARERMARETFAVGDIEPVGVAMLVRLAVASRDDGRLVLRGDGRLVELDFRRAGICTARLTEPDGRQVEGEDAILGALTLRSGRYSVRPSPAVHPPPAPRWKVPDELWRAADRLTALLQRVDPEHLPRVRRLRLRERAGTVRGLSSIELRARERLCGGDAPRTLLGAPGLDAATLARLAEKLVLMGDVVEVEEDDGAPPSPPAEPAAPTRPAIPPPIEPTPPTPATAAAPAVVLAAPAAPTPLAAVADAPSIETLAPSEAVEEPASVPDHRPPPEPLPPPPPPEPLPPPPPPEPLPPPPPPEPLLPPPPPEPRPAPAAPKRSEPPPLPAAVSVPRPVPPPLASARRPRRRPPWVALGTIVALAVTAAAAYVYIAGWPGSSRTAATAPEPAADGAGSSIVPPAVVVAGADAAPEISADDGTADAAPEIAMEVESTDTAPDGSADDGTADAAPDAPEDDGRSADAAAPREAAVRDAERTAAPCDVNGPAAGPAVLIIPRPEGIDVALEVYVDGARRGTAPAQLELEPGAHEVRFAAGGRESLSIVRLHAGERRTLAPLQLLRELRQGGP